MEKTENLFVDLPNPRKDIEDLQPYSAPLEGRRNLLRLDFNAVSYTHLTLPTIYSV